jgi:hypothetical protein
MEEECVGAKAQSLAVMGASSGLPVLEGDVPPFERKAVVRKRCHERFSNLVAWIESQAEGETCAPFSAVERGAVERVFELGRLLLLLFLVCAEERTAASLEPRVREWDLSYERGARKPRVIGTFFGKVCFWRTWMSPIRRDRRRRYRGFFPLDRALGLTRDGFSALIVQLVLRLAAEMPFERAAETMTLFCGWSPSTRTIEELVLGAGPYARRFHAEAPPPEGDGDVLVIQIDSKGAPMATDAELGAALSRRPLGMEFSSSIRGLEPCAR